MMNAKKLVLKKPTAPELLDQITPWVRDDAHESKFLSLFATRKKLAATVADFAKKGQLNTAKLVALVRQEPAFISVLISLLGISQEEFYRHVTLVRLEKHKQLQAGNNDEFREWKMDKIVKEICADKDFAEAVLSLLLNGRNDPALRDRIPDFLLAKLDGSRLANLGHGGIDALVRSGLKGAYDAGKGTPVVAEVRLVLDSVKVDYHIGEITVPHLSRKLDCVIPNKNEPHVLMEVGVFATTARELSEKGLVEQLVQQEVRAHYPEAVLVRVVDGVGWIARGGTALTNVIAASDYIFTQKTLPELRKVVKAHVPKKYFH
jgi:hypothetical protein